MNRNQALQLICESLNDLILHDMDLLERILKEECIDDENEQLRRENMELRGLLESVNREKVRNQEVYSNLAAEYTPFSLATFSTKSIKFLDGSDKNKDFLCIS